MSDFDLPGNARQALGNSGLDQASSAAKHHNKEGQPDLSGLTVADTRKCSYAMQLCASALSSFAFVSAQLLFSRFRFLLTVETCASAVLFRRSRSADATMHRL